MSESSRLGCCRVLILLILVEDKLCIIQPSTLALNLSISGRKCLAFGYWVERERGSPRYLTVSLPIDISRIALSSSFSLQPLLEKKLLLDLLIAFEKNCAEFQLCLRTWKMEAHPQWLLGAQPILGLRPDGYLSKSLTYMRSYPDGCFPLCLQRGKTYKKKVEELNYKYS